MQAASAHFDPKGSFPMRFSRSTHFSSPPGPPRRAVLLALTAVGGAALLSGCGSSGTTNNGSGALIRAIDTSANGGTTAVFVNSSQVGTQSYFGGTSYQNEAAGLDSATFSLSATSGTTYPVLTQSFLAGEYYSLILVGRSDVTSPADPRYPTLIATQDTFTTASTSQAAVRVVGAAPDLGPVDVLVNGSVVAGGAAYKSVSSLVTAPSGGVSVQVNTAGTTAAVVPAQTINLTAGHVYTFYVVEPVVSATPGYGLQETDDTTSAAAG